MIGHTSTGDIQWLGTGEELDRNFSGQLLEAFDKDTKFIVMEQKYIQVVLEVHCLIKMDILLIEYIDI